MFGGVQLYRWLNLDGQYFFGDAVFYDPVDPYPGTSYEGGFGVNLQPSGRLSQAFNYRRISFDHALTGEHVYDIDLIYSRTTYQFSRQFFVRGIAQYDSSRSRVLTDFLASYELRPGTVVYAGYGSLIERRGFRRWRMDHRRRRIRGEPARAVLQGVVPVSLLALSRGFAPRITTHNTGSPRITPPRISYGRPRRSAYGQHGRHGSLL